MGDMIHCPHCATYHFRNDPCPHVAARHMQSGSGSSGENTFSDVPSVHYEVVKDDMHPVGNRLAVSFAEMNADHDREFTQMADAINALLSDFAHGCPLFDNGTTVLHPSDPIIRFERAPGCKRFTLFVRLPAEESAKVREVLASRGCDHQGRALETCLLTPGGQP